MRLVFCSIDLLLTDFLLPSLFASFYRPLGWHLFTLLIFPYIFFWNFGEILIFVLTSAFSNKIYSPLFWALYFTRFIYYTPVFVLPERAAISSAKHGLLWGLTSTYPWETGRLYLFVNLFVFFRERMFPKRLINFIYPRRKDSWKQTA